VDGDVHGVSAELAKDVNALDSAGVALSMVRCSVAEEVAA
jgi:hypothetical protein